MPRLLPRRTAARPHFDHLEPRLLLDAIPGTGPWIQGVLQTSAYILLEANSTATATVDYGLTSSYTNSATTGSTETANLSGTNYYIHNVKLTGLAANTQYHYRVRQGATTTADYAFWTAAPAGTSFRFAFMADARTNTAIHSTIAGLVDAYDPRFVIWGGDVCNDTNAWNTEFFVPGQVTLDTTTPFYFTAGNHEAWNANTRAFTQSPTNHDGNGYNDSYYSFDYGDFHFVMINNYDPGGYGVGSAQYTFVQGDLAPSRPWEIAVFHNHGYAVSNGHGEDAGMKTMTANLFEPLGVDMTLAGHSHCFQHNRVNGIEHMLIGSVGAPLHTPIWQSYTIAQAQDYCFGIFDVTPTSLTLHVYNASNTLLDTVTVGPTDIALSNNSVAEGQASGATVGTLSTTDPAPGGPYTYTLVGGDTASFSIAGSTLKTAATFDYETKSSYNITIRSTDSGAHWLEEPFTINVTNVAEIVDRHVFYNNSAMDGNTAGADPLDDNAIDAAKTALLPGQTGSGANITAAYSGLNGVMADIEGLANPGRSTRPTSPARPGPPPTRRAGPPSRRPSPTARPPARAAATASRSSSTTTPLWTSGSR